MENILKQIRSLENVSNLPHYNPVNVEDLYSYYNWLTSNAISYDEQMF